MYVKTKNGIDKIVPESIEERLIRFERARAARRAALCFRALSSHEFRTFIKEG